MPIVAETFGLHAPVWKTHHAVFHFGTIPTQRVRVLARPWRLTNPCLFFFGFLFSNLQKYRITKRVGGGSFGDIYLGVGANGEKVGFFLVLSVEMRCNAVVGDSDESR